MKRYTVFVGAPNRDPIDDPPLWAQVKANDYAKALDKTRKAFAADFEEAGVELPNDGNEEDFPLVMIVEGWPKFVTEL